MTTPMARYVRGNPLTVPYTPGSSYNAGDVIVQGGSPFVAHVDNPVGTGTGIRQGSVSAMLAQYVMQSDAAYANGTWVYWNPTLQQVSTTFGTGCVPFGQIVGGPGLVLDDGGPLAAGNCLVNHLPILASAMLQSAQPAAFPRNMIDGGDMTVNPAQRGTSQVADIANTTTYGPDRFAFKGGGAGSLINWSINADTSVAGFSKSLKFQRKATNADVTVLSMCQALETVDSVRAQGLQVTISFWAKKGANYSGGNLTVQVESGQGTDQSAANLIAGSWTSQAHVVNQGQALTTTMTRYQFTGTVPAATTQLGLIFQWTPTGTAGADDSITINGIQLEIGAGASAFEHRDIEMELALCQRYFYQLNEPASGNLVAAGQVSATNTELFVLGLPVTMRAAPTVTVTVGSFKSNSSTAGIVAATGLAASGTHTSTQVGLTSTGTGTAGQAATLQGGGGAGLIACSADL